MKAPRDWDEAYLLNLPIGEFDWLEVKGRRGLDLTVPNVSEADVRENLSRAASAFANSGGGVIVLGLGNPQTTWRVDDGGVELAIKRPSTREWLEDIIPTLVDLPLRSFNVYCIQNTGADSQIAPGRGVFIIEIPDSTQAPHQATDNKYYARVGGKSRPIGHRLVTDIFGRRQHPLLHLEFGIQTSTYIDGGPFQSFSVPVLGSKVEPERKRKVELIISAHNEGRVFAKYVNSIIYIPLALLTEFERATTPPGDIEEVDGIQYVVWQKRNTQRDVVKAEAFGAHQYGSAWFDPILPGLSYTWEWEITEDFNEQQFGDLKIMWDVYADNAPKQSGSVFVRDIDITVKADE